MKDSKSVELIQWPNFELVENFQFDAITSAGTITLQFKWLNDRWNLWVTLPDGTVREAGVYPGVLSWSGFNDYGLLFKSNVAEIDYSSLLLTEVYFIVWQ